MTTTKTVPQGISIIYFNEPHKNIYAKLPADREKAKRLARRIYGDAMKDLSEDKRKCRLLREALAE